MRRLGLASMSLGGLGLLWWCRPSAGPTPGLDSAIVCAASWTAWLCAAYFGVAIAATAAAVAAPLPGCAARLIDRALGVGVAVGAAIATTGLVGPAAADGSS